MRRRERHLVERMQQLPQIPQWRVGARPLDDCQAFRGAQRFMGLGDRVGQRVAQSLRGTRRDGLRLSRGEPARVGHVGIDRERRGLASGARAASSPADQDQQGPSGEQQRGDDGNRTRPIEPQRPQRRLRRRRAETVGNHTGHVKRRGASRQRVGCAVGTETPDLWHVEPQVAGCPGDDGVAHDPVSERRRYDGGIAQRLGHGSRGEFPGPQAPAGWCLHRSLEPDRVTTVG